jgi:transposase
MCICCRERRVYPSDVTDAEWAILESLIPPAKPGGRPEEIERREIVNGITNAWITHHRRLSRDFEGTHTSGEAFIYLAMTRLMVSRLARARP